MKAGFGDIGKTVGPKNAAVSMRIIARFNCALRSA
jgi:hypothetical protein